MKLHYQVYSEAGPKLLVLHGLFGSLSNWASICKILAEDYGVIGVDLRNHGRSPHSDNMDYPLMAGDVLELMDSLAIERCALLGHSMGGKVAMELALANPERVERLLVVDIAPVTYSGGDSHLDIIAAMASLPLENLKNRNEADAKLAEVIAEEPVRQFILTNLARNEAGSLQWRLNLPAIEQHYDKLRQEPTARGPYSGPVLFIKGGLSSYIQEAHEQATRELFPAAEVKIVKQAGHWVHAEQPRVLLSLVRGFLGKAQS